MGISEKEWKLIGITQADEPETCPCGHTPIIDLCEITNQITGKNIEVGNVCVKRFLGFRSDLIFAAIKRIKKDISKSVGVDVTAFFYEERVINTWEYSFQQETMGKRNLFFGQLSKRTQINEKILASIKRRGIV